MPTVASLVAEVKIQGADTAKQQLSNVGQAAKETQSGFGGMLQSALATAGGFALFNVGAKAVGFLKDQVVGSLDAAMKHQQVMSQTAQAVKSTGGAAGMTAQAIQGLAESLSKTTTFSEDTVQSGENLLLTFTGIGKDVFPQTTKTMLDMAQAMGMDTKSAAMQLGKALNDPAQGLSALSREGVTFSDKQKEMIKQMVAAGNTAGAQKIMLAELQKEFGGSAEAAGKTFAGALQILKNNLEDVKIKIGTALLPLLGQLTGWVSSNVLPILTKFSDWFSNVGVASIQNFGSTLGNTFTSVGHYLSLFDLTPITYAWKQFTNAVQELLNPLRTDSDVMGMLTPHLADMRNLFSQLLVSGIRDIAGFITNIANAVKGFAENINIENISSFSDGLKQVEPPLQNIWNLLKGELGKELQDLGKDAKQVGDWFMSSVIPAFKQAAPGFENLGNTVLNTVIPAFIKIRGVVVDVLQNAFDKFAPILEKIIPPLIKFEGIIANNVSNALKFITPYILQATKAIGDFANDLIDRIAPIALNVFNGISDGVKTFSKIWAVIWPGISQILKGVWDEIVGVVKIAWALITGHIKVGLDLLSGNWKQAWTDFKQMFVDVWDGIKTYFSGVWEIIKGTVKTMVDGIIGFFKYLWDELTGHSIIPDMINDIINWFGKLPGQLMNFWNTIKTDVTNAWNWIWTTISNKSSDIFNGIMKPFNQARDSIGGVVKSFINNCISMLNNGITGVESFVNFFGNAIDFVAGKLGAGSPIPHFGLGRIPQYASGTDSHPGGPAIVGERGRELVMLHRGASVLPNDKTEALLGMLRGRIPGYADGIGQAAADFFNWVAGGAKSLLDNALKAFNVKAPNLPGMSNLASAMMTKIEDFALSWINKILPNFSSGPGGTPVNIPGNLQSWIAQAIAATGAPANWAADLGVIAMHESGGNPNAVNNWDSNAQAGDPSRGLFQTIGATFRAYALPGHGNILNPVDNAIAAIRYIMSRYGDVFHVPGIVSMAQGGSYVGYANGGTVNQDGTYMVGERGPEAVYLPRGANVISNSQLRSAQAPQPVTIIVNLAGRNVGEILLPDITQAIRYSVGTHGM